MARANVTISDVAKRAKVSVGTVSHVLTGRIKVTADRRARVLRAIESLDYVPNFHAQGLRRTLSGIVGICVPHVSTAYLNALSEALEDIATRDGRDIMHVFSRHDPKAEFRRIRELMRYQVDGLILFPSTAPESSLDLAYGKSLPVVLVDRPFVDARFDQVMIDNRKVMREAVARLIALGHRDLLFVCRSRMLLVTRHRIEGLRAAQRAAPARVSATVLEIRDDEAAFQRHFATTLRAKAAPTAIVASNSQQASLVLGFLRALGVNCPDDASVLTFDDPEWANLVVPTLSVIRQPAMTIARTAWDLLMRRIEDPTRAPRTIALESTIEFRDSVAAPGGRAKKSPGPTAKRARAG